MLSYLLRRLLIAIPILLGVTIMNFYIINLAPGDAVDLMVDPGMTQADVERQREDLGLNDALHVRYGKWLGNLLKGNLGTSFHTNEAVTKRIGERLGPTLLLAVAAFIVSYLIAIPIGTLSAVRQYSWVDYVSSVLGLVGISVPTFFLGLVAIYVFSLKLDLLPTGGMMKIGGTGSLGDRLTHLIMPALVLGLNATGAVMRYTRSSVLEVLRLDYMRTARAKGLRNLTVIFKHGLRNAAIPIVTIMTFQMTNLLGGAIVTEQVFQWPGLGRLTLDAITQRDYPVLMGINLVTAIIVVGLNLLSDAIYAAIDPRITYS